MSEASIESVYMDFYRLTIGVLCVWRITHLLNAEDGPWDLLVRLRLLAGAGVFGSLLDCFFCLSLWIAVPFAHFLGKGWGERLLLWPALSAGAILLERITYRGPSIAPAPFFEEEKENVLLRKEASGGSQLGREPERD